MLANLSAVLVLQRAWQDAAVVARAAQAELKGLYPAEQTAPKGDELPARTASSDARAAPAARPEARRRKSLGARGERAPRAERLGPLAEAAAATAAAARCNEAAALAGAGDAEGAAAALEAGAAIARAAFPPFCSLAMALVDGARRAAARASGDASSPPAGGGGRGAGAGAARGAAAAGDEFWERFPAGPPGEGDKARTGREDGGGGASRGAVGARGARVGEKAAGGGAAAGGADGGKARLADLVQGYVMEVRAAVRAPALPPARARHGHARGRVRPSRAALTAGAAPG